MMAKALFTCIVLFAAAFPSKADEENRETQNVAWLLPVAVPRAQASQLATKASELREVLQVQLSVLEVDENPGCCIWLEVGLWSPEPDRPGYLVIIQPGGARLIASNIEQLDAAIDAIRNVMEVDEGQVLLPVGILTNYRVIAP